MSSLYRSIYTAFTLELKRYKPIKYYSSDSIIQSSVGLIFRISPMPTSNNYLSDISKV